MIPLAGGRGEKATDGEDTEIEVLSLVITDGGQKIPGPLLISVGEGQDRGRANIGLWISELFFELVQGPWIGHGGQGFGR
jgi:hypothetical protein